MSNRATIMPDFTDVLERDLRTEAASLAAAAPLRRSRRRRATLAAGLAIGAGAVAVVVSSLGSSTDPAYAGPLIVKAPQVDAPEVARRMESGVTAQYTLGGDVHFDQVREIATDAGPAYLVGGAKGWCLSVPDAASPNPSQERGGSCATSAEFNRIGVSVSVGGWYVAALPQGVRNPTLKRKSMSTTELTPSKYGVVSIAVRPGDVVTMYSTSGAPRADRINGA